MDLTSYAHILRKRWRLIAACMILAVAAAVLATYSTTPMYQAQAQLFVSAGNPTNDISGANQGGQFTAQRVKSYADIVNTPPVVEPVITKLKLDETADQLAQHINTTNPLDTVLLQVNVTDPDAVRAGDIANAVAEQFTHVVSALETPTGSATPLVKATVVKPATRPTTPVSPRPKVNLALGLLIGLAIGVGGAVLRETLDTTVKSPEEIKELSGAPVLGIVPDDPHAKETPLLVDTTEDKSGRAESYRQVRTNLQFLGVDKATRTLVITSAIPEEGKTTTACNIAIALVESGLRVILVEADLRRPRLAEYLGIEGAVGITSVLLGQANVADVIQTWGRQRLQVLPSGPIPPNPSELLGSRQMGTLIATLTTASDIVILDAPPLLPVTDAAVLASRCDGALIIARYGHTKRDQLAAAADALRKVGAAPLGVVLNRAPRKGVGYGYGYGYASGYTSSNNRLRVPASVDGSAAMPDQQSQHATVE